MSDSILSDEVADPEADFVELTILRLGLSSQREETAQITRWLDAGARELLALWWLEAAGELDRGELVAALGLPATHVAVRIGRMKDQLTICRVVVRALRAEPSTHPPTHPPALGYVHRYAWFGLEATPADGSMGLFSSAAAATTAGRAFQPAG